MNVEMGVEMNVGKELNAECIQIEKNVWDREKRIVKIWDQEGKDENERDCRAVRQIGQVKGDEIDMKQL